MQRGVWGSAISSPSGVWDGAPPKLNFCILGLQSDIWWGGNKFIHFLEKQITKFYVEFPQMLCRNWSMWIVLSYTVYSQFDVCANNAKHRIKSMMTGTRAALTRLQMTIWLFAWILIKGASQWTNLYCNIKSISFEKWLNYIKVFNACMMQPAIGGMHAKERPGCSGLWGGM